MRQDGRLPNTMRKVNVTTDFIKYAEGSCLFEMGNTKVICTASIEDGVPPFLRGQDRGWITSEYSMLPRSCQRRVPRESSKGKKGGRTHEIQRLVGRALRGIVDLDMIGERTIWMDCDVIQADGGTRTVAISGSYVALYYALSELVKNGKIHQSVFLPPVAAISVGIINGSCILDLCYEEDSVADVDVNVVMNEAEEFVEIQGTAEGKPFSTVELTSMLDLARGGIREIINSQKHIFS